VPALLFPRPIGEPEIAKIAALADPVLRNLWITTAYHDFAVSMARLVGPANVSWPAFATWASKTAGASIRGDVLPRRIRDVLSRSWAYRRAVALVKARLSGTAVEIDVDIFDAIREAVAAVSQQIAAGNLTVFQELGPLFARMVATFDGPSSSDPARRAALIAWVQALDGDAVATARLRTVFGQFCDSMLDAERTLRADQILLANGLAGLTEQIRLQPNIQGALDAPIETSLGEWLDRTVANLPEAVRAGARPILRLVVIEIEAVWRRVATEFLMELATPSGDLNLGKDVPAPPGGPLFPEDLGAIRGPELVALLAEYDRTGGTGIGSGADDWAKLPQRMNYILNLFRSRQQDGALLLPPFTDAQWAEMQAGRVPPGDL
jgi:hypothetical protein